MNDVQDEYLPARRVWERYGVTPMSLHRWVRDPKRAFPEPLYIGRFRYWRLADLIAWERKLAASGRATVEGEAA